MAGNPKKTVDAVDEFALRMAEKQGTRAFAGNGQNAGLVAALTFRAIAARPGDLFRTRAFGKLLAGNLVP